MDHGAEGGTRGSEELPEDGFPAVIRTVEYPTDVDFASVFPMGEVPRYRPSFPTGQ